MCSARNTYAECTKNTYADDTTADTDAWAAQLSGLVSNDDTWIGGKTHLVQRKTGQQKNKYTRKTGKTAGNRKTKTANKSLSTEAMERSRRVGGAARKAVEDVSHAWRC